MQRGTIIGTLTAVQKMNKMDRPCFHSSPSVDQYGREVEWEKCLQQTFSDLVSPQMFKPSVPPTHTMNWPAPRLRVLDAAHQKRNLAECERFLQVEESAIDEPPSSLSTECTLSLSTVFTGVQYSVHDFVNAAARELGMQIRWEGKGPDEVGILSPHPSALILSPHTSLLSTDSSPTEVETLLGDATKAREKLGWTPRITFDELVAEMVRSDFKSAERDELIKKHGYMAMDCHE